MSDNSPKKQYSPAYITQKEIAQARADEKYQQEAAELDAAYGPDLSEETLDDIKQQMEHIKAVAKQTFPEGANHLGLTEKQRLAAVASCLGWSQSKISKSLSVVPQTISKWLARPDVKVFITEFNLKRGDASTDIMQKLKGLEYQSTLIMEKILSDKRGDNDLNLRRLQYDAGKWVFERTRGKAVTPIEHRGENINKLLNSMSQLSKDFKVSDEEAEKLFDESELN